MVTKFIPYSYHSIDIGFSDDHPLSEQPQNKTFGQKNTHVRLWATHGCHYIISSLHQENISLL